MGLLTAALAMAGPAAAQSPPPAAAPSVESAPTDEPPEAPAETGPAMTMETFLDRLMIAESGGRLEARNPRSTALGPFQFIESTFLAVARRHFAAETASLSPQEILALRTDLAFSRRAAEAYTRDNAAILQSQDVAPTYPHLRLAFLLGAAGAVRVIKAPPDAPLAGLLGPAVLVANPFMASLTAHGLVARSAREVAQPVTSSQAVQVPPGTAPPRRILPPGVSIRCNLRLPSCKRWLALVTTAKARAATPQAKGPAKTTFAAAGPGKAAALSDSTPAQPLTPAAAMRVPRKVSPTMEAAARGIPLSTRPRSQAVLRTALAKTSRNARGRR